jgi:hypothetical protein
MSQDNFLSDEYIIENVDNLDLCEIMMNQKLSEKTISLIMHKFTQKEWVYLKFTQDTPNIENKVVDQIDLSNVDSCLILLLLDLMKISNSTMNT